jgi:hypothetical protein
LAVSRPGSGDRAAGGEVEACRLCRRLRRFRVGDHGDGCARDSGHDRGIVHRRRGKPPPVPFLDNLLAPFRDGAAAMTLPAGGPGLRRRLAREQMISQISPSPTKAAIRRVG